MNKDQAAALLKKYNEGAASTEESRLVENWFITESVSPTDNDEQVDYLQIKQDMWIHVMDKVTLTPKRKLYRWHYGVAAAAVVVFAFVGIVLFKLSPPPNPDQIVQIDSITPGKNNAVLTLSDGRKISLSDAQKGALAEESGVVIRKSEEGQLIYQILDQQHHATSESYNTIEAPKGGQWQVILPDGSKVFLNAMSSLRYPVKFGSAERKVELKGEGYFEIKHDKKSPFRVVTGQQTVEVLGTHFNIMAYGGDELIKTTLLSGRIKVSHDNKSNILKPGEQSVLSNSNITISNHVDIEEVVAWKNGYFKLNENLESIMTKISRWYDVEIVYESHPDPYYKYQGELSRDKDIQEILSMLEYTGNVHFEIKGRRVLVKP